MPQSLPSLQVSLLNDTGVSATDRLTQDSRLKFTGLVEGGTVQYSTNGQVWTATAPDAKQGLNTVYVRQIDAVGDYSAHSIIQYTFDNIAPTASLVINLRNDTGVSGDLVTREGALVVTNVGSGNRVEYSNNNLTWTTSQPTVVEGMNTVYIRQVDNAGNGSPVQTYDFVFDSKAIPPIVALIHDTGSSASDRVTNDARLSVTGTESGATIQYSKDGVTWGTTAPTATEGLNVVYVRQLDVTGNTSSANKFSFYFDSSAPQALSVSLLNDDGISNTDSITTDARLRLTGTESGAKVQYSANGQDWQDSAPVAVEGANTVYVRQTDVAGNISPVASINFTLGAVTPPPPPPPVIPPADLVIGLVRDTGVAGDLLTRDGSIAVSNVGQGNRLEYSSNGTDWSVNKPALVEGSNTVYVRQVNSAGNASTGQSMSFVLDRTVSAPIVSLLEDTGSSASDRRTSKGQLVVSGVEADATVQYSVNGTTWSTTQPVAVEGLNRVLVRQVDKAGNTSQHVVFQFTLDTTAPDVALNLSLRNDTGVDGDLISRSGAVLVRGATAGNRIEYSADGMDWSIKQPTAQEGANTVWVRLVDVAGNASSGQKLDFIIDTKAAVPEAKLLNDSGVLATDLLTNDDRLLVSGLELGAKAQYSTNNKDWSDTPAVSREGLNIVYVRQMDIAGNISSVKKLSYVYDSQISALQLALVEDTGLSSSDQITRRPMVSVSGLESGASWQYQVDGAGSWITGTGSSFNLVSGSHRYVVRHTDKAGNVVESSLTATLDTTVDAVQVVLTEDTGISATDGISQVTELTVSNIEDGALVEYSTDGTTWSRTAPTAQEGSNTVWVRQTDKAGNVSAAQQLQFVKDTQIQTPSLSFTDTGASDSDGITREPTVTVNGLEAGASWQYQVDGGLWQDGVGNSFNLVDGVHSYLVRQTDKAGNVATSAVLNVEFIGNPSTISVQMLDSQGNIVENGASNDPNAVLRLSGDSTDIWQYRYIDPVAGRGEWQDVSGSQDVNLTEGAYNIETRKIDIAGNFVSTLTRVKIDTTVLTPTMTLVEDTGELGDNISTNPVVAVGGLEAGSIWEVRIDDSPYWNQTTLDGNKFKLSVGTHTYYIRQTDKAGNASEIGEYVFTYQSAVAQPILVLADDTGARNNDFISSNSTVNVTGLLPDAIWQYQIDDSGVWIDGTGSSFEMLTDGLAHTYTIRQQSNGLWSEPSTVAGVRFDNSTPSSAFDITLAADSGDSANDGITNNGQMVISNLEVGARLQYRIDGGEWQGVEISNSTMNLSLLDVGTHDYDFRQVDTAGNASATISRSYTYINADLAAPSLALANDTGVEVDDSLTSNGQINVSLSVVGTGVSWQYEVDGNGIWLNGVGTSFTAQAGLHSYKVRQLDVAGNTSPVSDALTVDFDNTAPSFSSATTASVVDADSERQQLVSTSTVLYTATAEAGARLSMLENDVFNFNETTGELTFKQAVGYQSNGNNSYTATLSAMDVAGNITLQTVTIDINRTNISTPTINLAEPKTGISTLDSSYINLTFNADGTMFYIRKDSSNNLFLYKANVDGSLAAGFTPYHLTSVLANAMDSFNSSRPSSITVDASGKIILGSSYVFGRLNADGTADTSFGVNGVVQFNQTAPTGFEYRLFASELDGQGRAYFVGSQINNQGHTQTQDSLLTIYNANGTLLSSTVINSAGTNNSDRYTKVLPVGSNAVYLVTKGFFYPGSTGGSENDFIVQKFVNGAVDTSFATSGRINVPATSNPDDYNNIVTDALGRLIISQPNGSAIKFYRYNTNGSLDTTFASLGVFTLNNVSNDRIQVMADNSLYLHVTNNSTGKTELRHLLNTGALDTAFGTSGVFVDPTSSINDVHVNQNNQLHYVASNQIHHLNIINGKPVYNNDFGNVALTYNEGNRPIGLLSAAGTMSDSDAVTTNYAGVSVTIARQGGANSDDVFGARGQLVFGEDGSLLWNGQLVGTVSQHNGTLTLVFNNVVNQSIVEGVTHAITYRNTNQQLLTGQIKLAWTINDNDPTGAKSATALQTVNLVNDNADVGDSQFTATVNNTTVNLHSMIQVDGKYYYVIDSYPDYSGHDHLDNFFNNGQDTTVSARTAQQTDGTVFKLLTSAEIDSLMAHSTIVNNAFWSNLFQSQISSDNTRIIRGVWSADLGEYSDTHLFKADYTDNQFLSSFDQDDFTRFAIVEVTPSANPPAAYTEPTLKLITDNGDSDTDRITSDGRFQVIGLNSGLPYELSTDGGQTWVAQAAGNLIIDVPAGSYKVGDIRVRQTDSGGFVDTIISNNTYKIDKNIKAIGLFNDQGLKLTDGITADGRVVINGLDNNLPYEYSVDGGDNWQTGGQLANGQFGFTLALGTYAARSVIIRQTDENGLTSFARNTSTYQIDNVVGQGKITLVSDNGDSNTDYVTSDRRLFVSGLRAGADFEYSLNNGGSWTTVTGNLYSEAILPVPQGSYAANQIQVRQTDSTTGFTTIVSHDHAFLIDTTVKSIDLFNDQGLSTRDNISADGRIVAKGFNTALAYQYSTDGSTWLTGTKVGDEFIFSLSAGTYAANQIQVRQTDANNLTTIARSTSSITISPTAAQGAISLSVDSGSSNTDNITNVGRISVTGLRGGLAWQYRLNGGAWQEGTVSSTDIQTLNLPQGSYGLNQIQVRQTDTNGFVTTLSNASAYTVDQSIATANITLVNDSGYSNTDLLTADGRVRFNITGTLADGDTWSYSVDNGTTWQYGSGTTATISLANGSYAAQSIRVKVVDVAGNASTASFDKRLVVDNTDVSAPVFTSQTQSATFDRDGTGSAKVPTDRVVHTVTATDANSVYYSLSGTHAHLFNINSNGQIKFNNETNLSNAQGDRYQLTINAVDAFNNSSSQNVSILVRDTLHLTAKSTKRAFEQIRRSDDLTLTFNQDIAFNPTGEILLNDRKLDINDPTQVIIQGNKLIIQSNNLSEGYHIIKVYRGIKALDTDATWSTSWNDPIGFSLSSDVGYIKHRMTPEDSFEVKTQDGSEQGTVAILGDVNGDGIDDWAVSYAKGDSLGRSDNGKIYVVYGRTDGVAPNLANVANGQGGYLISGHSSGDNAGGLISAAGDVNADGLQDLLIHAKGANGGQGKGYIIYGRTNATNLDLGIVDNNSSYGRVYNNSIVDSFDAIGDINSDGYDDVAHSRAQINRTTVVDEIITTKSRFTVNGQIRVQADWLAFAADWVEVGATVAAFFDDPESALIETAAELPDIIKSQTNNDAEQDIDPIEEAFFNQLEELTGKLVKNEAVTEKIVDFSFKQTAGGGGGNLITPPSDIVYTTTFTVERTLKSIYRTTTDQYGTGEAKIELGGANGNSGTREVTGNINAQQLGIQVTSLGDINGDGRADFGILDLGSGGVMPRFNIILGNKNITNIYSVNLAKGEGGFQIIDPSQTEKAEGKGQVKGLGDINGDGVNDFAITTDGQQTNSYIVYGRVGMNGVDLNQVAAGNGGFKLAGKLRGMATNVEAVGDFNGDGLDDFVFYQTYNGNINPETKIMVMVYGSQNGLPANFEFSDENMGKGEKGFVIKGDFSTYQSGFSNINPISAGDINGDGLSDLIIRSANGDTLFLMGSTTNGHYSQVRADQAGTTGNDTIVSAGKQQIVTGLGNDTVTTNGADVVLMGAGNDRAILSSSTINALYAGMGSGGNTDQLSRLDGGAGFDVLALSGGVSLDFTRISNKALDLEGLRERVDGFEKIDLATDTAANGLKLNLIDVLDIADSNIANTNNGWSNISGSSLSSLVAKHQLVVAGANNDTVTIRGSEWSNSGTTVRDSNGELYSVYNGQGAAAQLLIDKDMIISII
ncbi:Ig-like domain-containing protein [Agitococcus lubricus]|uniref:Beta-propeller uncharacterized protein DUF5122 n=1 Tax=Agitococcus lubricus TaxID=1077255 RepID=A0A2T5J463_9GAMM|nr:hypothetical protein [Agitococcus lubricus]PTQ91328.1 beta-propeller uncharacterized protein DUF5122 [Agitococcus lubricus]